MRCLVIDDEAPARLELRRLLTAHPGVEVVGEAARVTDALVLVETLRPDLVFLDIQLRGESGFDFVARLPADAPFRVVFVTAFDRHAIRAFECNALDYLLKPVLASRLAATLRRAAPLARLAPRRDDSVLVKTGNVARFVRWNDIVAVVSEGNYTRLHFAAGDTALVLRPLKEWAELAPARFFVQIHRAVLVQPIVVTGVRQISEDRRLALLANGKELPVGASYWPSLRNLLNC